MVPFSVLDLCPIVEGGDAAQAFRNSVEMAQLAERLGYRRFWLAEHHNMPGVASAATAVVLGHVAASTRTLRVGAGGVMLPNHAPLVVAEQFGTLGSLFPDRIDLGLGRAPGTDPFTARALRRGAVARIDTFPDDVAELRAYFDPPPGAMVRAVPGAGVDVPLWILGSSTFGAQLAARMGLPFAFASHFAPPSLDEALRLYRSQFQPSKQLARPYVMVGSNVVVGESEAEAKALLSSLQQAFVNLRSGRPTPLPAPAPGFREELDPDLGAMVDEILSCSFAGTEATVAAGLRRFLERTGADELMVSTPVFEHRLRLRSLEGTARVRDTLAS